MYRFVHNNAVCLFDSDGLSIWQNIKDFGNWWRTQFPYAGWCDPVPGTTYVGAAPDPDLLPSITGIKTALKEVYELVGKCELKGIGKFKSPMRGTPKRVIGLIHHTQVHLRVRQRLDLT